VGETRLLAITEESLGELETAQGFDLKAQTLFCGNMAHDTIIQVTNTAVHLINSNT
jgi:DNA damage-binding protein 1